MCSYVPVKEMNKGSYEHIYDQLPTLVASWLELGRRRTDIARFKGANLVEVLNFFQASSTQLRKSRPQLRGSFFICLHYSVNEFVSLVTALRQSKRTFRRN